VAVTVTTVSTTVTGSAVAPIDRDDLRAGVRAMAVLIVGAGSLAFRIVPLLAARRSPDQLARVAGWAGLTVLAAITVRAVALHRNDEVPGAPLLATISVGPGLALAYRGRSVLVSVASGAAAYLFVTAALAAI
jgi:branched-subunit amino acid transport protein